MIQLLTGIFYLSIVIQLAYWLVVFGRFVFINKTSTVTEDLPFVSIVIPFKNEISHLRSHLRAIIMQAYHDFEVVMVNDQSTDGGDFFVRDLTQEFDHVHLLNLENSTGKKAAIELGVDVAKGDWIVLTDADCLPKSSKWITHMINRSHGADVILGYGPYTPSPTLLNTFIRYETWYIALTYMSLHQWNHHYMAVGRNMLFKKAVFKEVEGYKTHRHLLSGSDDLLISSLSHKANIAIEHHPDSYVYSAPKSTWREQWQQKKRHLSTAIHYKSSTQAILTGLSLSQLMVYLSFMVLLFFGEVTHIILLTFIFRWVVMVLVAKCATQKIVEQGIVLLTPIMDFLLVLYYISLSFTFFYKPKKW